MNQTVYRSRLRLAAWFVSDGPVIVDVRRDRIPQWTPYTLRRPSSEVSPGRIHPNPDVASRQRKTRRWWATATSDYRIVISQLVLEECGAGDPTAAQERIDEIDGLSRLDITDDARNLANALMKAGAIPPSEPRDALHVAIATVHGVQYLVTWNFKHIANATLRGRINGVCRNNGYEPPIICTPEELAGMTDDPIDTD